MLRRVVSYKFTDVSEVLTVSVILMYGSLLCDDTANKSFIYHLHNSVFCWNFSLLESTTCTYIGTRVYIRAETQRHKTCRNKYLKTLLFHRHTPDIEQYEFQLHSKNQNCKNPPRIEHRIIT
jgi:hypothetical protein